MIVQMLLVAVVTVMPAVQEGICVSGRFEKRNTTEMKWNLDESFESHPAAKYLHIRRARPLLHMFHLTAFPAHVAIPLPLLLA